MYLKFKKMSLKIVLIKTFICSFFLFFSTTSAISLYSYNQFDPQFFLLMKVPTNILGFYGANLSAILFFIFGDASLLLTILIIALIRTTILKEYNILKIFLRFITVIFFSFMISLSFSHIGFNSGILGKAVLASLTAHLYEF